MGTILTAVRVRDALDVEGSRTLDPSPSLSGPVIFVVGNSRSGTTLTSRIMGRHPDVARLAELHFYDELWSPTADARLMNRADAERMAAHLCRRQDPASAKLAEATRRLVATIPDEDRSPSTLFATFMRGVAAQRRRSIPCEQTGRTVFYLDVVLRDFPRARVISLVRDPRDVLLSQKRKWRQKRNRERSVDVAFREISNYHPITMTRLWVAAVRAAEKYSSDERVHELRFEDLLSDPEKSVRGMYDFCGLDFQPRALLVPHRGSSNIPNRPDEKGIDPTRAGHWRQGGLTATEIWICQALAGAEMTRNGYQQVQVRPSLAPLLYYVASMPIKSAIALVVNAREMASPAHAIQRRLLGSNSHGGIASVRVLASLGKRFRSRMAMLDGSHRQVVVTGGTATTPAARPPRSV